MGFREKVTLSLVIAILLQITCRHCMPSTPRNSTFYERYPNNNKPVTPKPSVYLPTQAIKSKKSSLGKQQTAKAYNPLPNKSLYKTYNFPENEYPLDTSPKHSFNFGKNTNAYNKVITPGKNVVSSDINNLKREMKMKRKLTNNKQLNLDNSHTNNEMALALAKLTSDTEPRVLDSATFPDVQYPTNTMETWAPNYWNYLSLSKNDQQMVYPKVSEINRNPPRLTKARAHRFLQPYEKLKEGSDYSKASSKRSNPGGKGLNFTKTATSEKNSEDIIATSLISSIPTNSLDSNRTDIEYGQSSKNPGIDSNYLLPEKGANDENQSLTIKLENNTKSEQTDSNENVKATNLNTLKTAQTEQANYTENNSDQILGNLSNDNHSISLDSTINTFNDILNDVSVSGDTPTNMSRVNCTVDEPTDKLLVPITNYANDPNTASGFVQNNMQCTAFQSSDNIVTNNGGPRNPIPNIGLNNIITSPANYVTSLSNGITGSGTSIIIIPINNGVNNLQSDSPIVVYIPNNSLSRETPVPNYPQNNNSSGTMSDISNNTTLIPCPYITQMFNDNCTANAFVSELPVSGAPSNYVTNSESELPIFETLPTNSMCYNNENCPSSFKEDSSLSNPTSKTLSNSLLSKIPACGTVNETRTEMQNTKTDDQPSPQDLSDFNFTCSDLSLLSEDLYNKIQNDELPIIVREVSSDTLIPNIALTDNLVSSNDKTPLGTESNIYTKTFDKKSTSKTSFDTQHSSNLVDKSALVKNALKKATLALFPTDKQSLPVYNAVFKVLLSNATIRNMLTKKKPSTEYMAKEIKSHQGPIAMPDTANGFPDDEIILVIPSSSVTTTNNLRQPVKKSSSIPLVTVKKTISQNQISNKERQLTKTRSETPSHATVISNQANTNSLPMSMKSSLVPNLPTDPGSQMLSELKDETMATNQSTNTSNYNLPLSKDFNMISVNKTLETNIIHKTNSDSFLSANTSLSNTKINSLSSDVYSQSVPVLLSASLIPANTFEKSNTFFPILPQSVNLIQADSNTNFLDSISENEGQSNLTIFPTVSLWSEVSNVSATDNADRLYVSNSSIQPYKNSDISKDTQSLKIIKNDIQNPLGITVDSRNSFTELSDTLNKGIISDPRISDHKPSIENEKNAYVTPQPEEYNVNLPLQPNNEINNATCTEKVATVYSMLSSTPFNIWYLLPDDKVLDTSEDISSSEDVLVLPTYKARTETLSNNPVNDLSISVDMPHTLDEPSLTAYDGSYMPLYGQSLLKDGKLSVELLPDDKVLDTSEDMSRSKDGLVTPTDKARTETLSNNLVKDLSIPLEIPHRLDKPPLTVHEVSYIPLDGQSLLKDDELSRELLPDDKVLDTSKDMSRSEGGLVKPTDKARTETRSNNLVNDLSKSIPLDIPHTLDEPPLTVHEVSYIPLDGQSLLKDDELSRELLPDDKVLDTSKDMSRSEGGLVKPTDKARTETRSNNLVNDLSKSIPLDIPHTLDEPPLTVHEVSYIPLDGQSLLKDDALNIELPPDDKVFNKSEDMSRSEDGLVKPTDKARTETRSNNLVNDLSIPLVMPHAFDKSPFTVYEGSYIPLDEQSLVKNDALSIKLPQDDEVLVDTSEGISMSEDGLVVPTDKARTEILSNNPVNSLSIPIDMPHTLDKPQITVYEGSYIPLDEQSLSRDDTFGSINEDDDDLLIDSNETNRDLPPLNDSINMEELNTSSVIYIEDSPGMANDLLKSLDNESLERNLTDHLKNGLVTSNSVPTLLDDWTQPFDEILHNLTLIESNLNYLLGLNSNWTSQADILQTNSSSDPKNVSHIPKDVKHSKGNPIYNSTYISTLLEEIPQPSEIADDSKLEHETQEELYTFGSNESELPSDRFLSDIFDDSNLTVEDGEEIQLPYPENVPEDQDNFTEVKLLRPMSLPMAKAILENVLFNIYTGGLSIPLPKPHTRNKKQYKSSTKGFLLDSGW